MMRIVVVLACVIILVLGSAPSASAIPPPGFFQGEFVGFLCLQVPVPGFGSFFVLVQINFDEATEGGISLAQAESLFSFLGPLIIQSLGTPICSFSPAQLNSAGFDALSVSNLVLPQWEALGWQLYLTLDIFKTTRNLGYLFPGQTAVPIARGDLFLAVGNQLEYAGSVETLRSFLGL